MSGTRELPAPGEEMAAAGYGAMLMARLNAVATEVSGLLTRLGSVRPGPPITSVDRRRLADQAERSTAALDRVCEDLDDWIAQQGAVEAGVESAALRDLADVDVAEKEEAVTAASAMGLADVSSGQETLDQARAHLHEAVQGARVDGASWRQIGEALGITAQTAHKRFDPKARQRHAEYMRTRYRRLSSG